MTKKLRETLNVRLDEPLARELRRIALTWDTTESDAARNLLRYGIEVTRKLQAAHMAEPFSWEREREAWDSRPGLIEIEARWREMTDSELIERELYDWLPPTDDEIDENAP